MSRQNTVPERLLFYAALLLIVPLLFSCNQTPPENAGSQQDMPAVVMPSVPEQNIVFEEPDLPLPQEAKLTGQEEGAVEIFHDNLPRVAIIIDDMGYHQQLGDKLLALDLNLTFSFLPGAPFTLEQENRAWQQGRDIMLHMPMEAQDSSWNLGPGGLYLNYSPEKIRATVGKNLVAVPHAIGSNNHMGSKFTEDRAAMHEVLSVLKERGFFFVDSYTTAKSTGLDEAGKMNIPAARRHVFLDNVHDQKKICRQLKQLVALAKEKGWAIGIGHPNQATLQALTNCREQLLEKVEIVGASTLVK
jgi:polysaccharide deacetylase 2 family uncharacterized protein YibQ